MALPPRNFFWLFELASRWGCAPCDIVEWAAIEKLELIVSKPLIRLEDGPMAGLVVVHAADLLPMFRRDGDVPLELQIHRIRTESGDWIFLPEGHEITVTRTDIMLTKAVIDRFEDDHELRPKHSVTSSMGRYDWDGLYAYIVKRVHFQGLPESQNELVGELQDWFIRRSGDGEAPDERTIRRRITPLWRELTS